MPTLSNTYLQSTTSHITLSHISNFISILYRPTTLLLYTTLYYYLLLTKFYFCSTLHAQPYHLLSHAHLTPFFFFSPSITLASLHSTRPLPPTPSLSTRTHRAFAPRHPLHSYTTVTQTSHPP